MDVTPLASRRAAVDVLMACLDKGQPLDDALGQHRGFTALDPRDRAFVRLLLATTVRHLGEIFVGHALRDDLRPIFASSPGHSWRILRVELGTIQSIPDAPERSLVRK